MDVHYLRILTLLLWWTLHPVLGSSLKPADQYVRPTNSTLSFKGNRRPSTQRRTLSVQASYRYIHSIIVAVTVNLGSMNHAISNLLIVFFFFPSVVINGSVIGVTLHLYHLVPSWCKTVHFFLSIWLKARLTCFMHFWPLSSNEEEPRSYVYGSHCEWGELD